MRAVFDDSLLTGNKMIDAQHKELIDKINSLLISCENKNDKQGAVNMLNYLADYVDFHFAEEEQLQKEMEYPGIREHKIKHRELRLVVEDLHAMLEEEEGPSERFVEQVQKNVVDWLYYHIKTFDRSVAEYKFLKDNTERI
ncbi:hemerythrin family protein [Clostridium sp. AM58-1XD]|uniref:bacteriohemerythrin n=1 Tax=Clostridium sp. AM58-1XD TaxID=2292307 RepID=UPI000E46680D|nr:hemerythrin family protein [Clostridium sp. AM58-1XD]RGY99475.1 hemerythrin [Clostridium sp. AM58-1XD]